MLATLDSLRPRLVYVFLSHAHWDYFQRLSCSYLLQSSPEFSRNGDLMLQSKGKTHARMAKAFMIHMQDDEEIKASVSLLSPSFMTSYYIVTQLRLVQMSVQEHPKTSFPLSEIDSVRVESGKLNKNLFITLKGKNEIKLGGMDAETQDELPVLLERLIGQNTVSTELSIDSREELAGRYSSIPTNRTKEKLPKHLVEAIRRNSKSNEIPLMLITGQTDSTDGSLIVFEDRCVISKSGFWGGLMSGSLGGARDATFYFRDITGVEYNSGMLMGVLEVLTASYAGGDTKDYWQGTADVRKGLSRNDPRVQSNTLPLPKSDYRSAKPLIDKLRMMISEAKETKVTVVNQPETPKGGVAEEIAKLAELLEKGLIDEGEFKAAKSKLLDS